MRQLATAVRRTIQYGDKVRFLEEPYWGMEGHVYRTNMDKAMVAPDIFCRCAPFEVEMSKLERVPWPSEFRPPPAWLEAKRAELCAICKNCGVQRLELFGSATTEEFDSATSDLDFIVLFQHRRPDDPRVLYFDLLEALEGLFGRPVDLVDETAIENPFFLNAIEPTRTLVYAP